MITVLIILGIWLGIGFISIVVGSIIIWEIPQFKYILIFTVFGILSVISIVETLIKQDYKINSSDMEPKDELNKQEKDEISKSKKDIIEKDQDNIDIGELKKEMISSDEDLKGD